MSYQQYADAMDALGDPTRREILELLRGGPLAVGEIAADLPVSRPAVSKHLRIMKAAGLVKDRPEGTRRLYELNPAGFASALTHWDDFWDLALRQFKAAAESERMEETR